MKPDFFIAQWNNPLNNEGWLLFKVGSCHGQWRLTDTNYEILTIINDQPGNGDFNTTLEYFYTSCKRDKKNLLIREVWNKQLLRQLIQKQGFSSLNKYDVIKKFI